MVKFSLIKREKEMARREDNPFPIQNHIYLRFCCLVLCKCDNNKRSHSVCTFQNDSDNCTFRFYGENEKNVSIWHFFLSDFSSKIEAVNDLEMQLLCIAPFKC